MQINRQRTEDATIAKVPVNICIEIELKSIAYSNIRLVCDDRP